MTLPNMARRMASRSASFDALAHISFDGLLHGGLDARELKADSVTAYLNGVGSAKVYAKKSANMYLHGMGSITVYGNPATRNSEVSGFGKINWEQ